MVAIRHSPEDRTHPFSCSTNLANEITERLIHAKLSSRALEFCLSLQQHTLRNEDGHRTPGRPEWRCPFDLGTWARALDWDKSNLRRLRQRLEACHIVHFEPDQDHPGEGWLEWNLALEEWQPYDGRRLRQQQANVVKLKRQKPRTGVSQQESGGRSAAQVHAPRAMPPADVVSRTPQEEVSLADQPAGVVKSAQQDRECVSPPEGGGGHAAQASAPFQQASMVSLPEQHHLPGQQTGMVNVPPLDGSAGGAKHLCSLVEPLMGIPTPASHQMPPEQGAAAPSEQGSVVKLPLPEAAPTGANELRQLGRHVWHLTTPASSQMAPEATSGAVSQQIGMVKLPEQHTVSIQQAGMVKLLSAETASGGPKELCQPAARELSMTTPASSHAALEVTSLDLLREEQEKNCMTETPFVVSEGQSPSPKAFASDALPQEEDEAIVAALHHPMPASSREPQDPSTSPRAFAWPARAPHEQTDLDLYQRVVREREGQRVALLTRLAHERISVPLASQSYARIGALAKQCGAGLLVKHILQAAAQHIDGDPLDYLTKLATNAKQKETSDGTRPSHPAQRPTAYPSNIQTYTPEEARQLVWHTI